MKLLKLLTVLLFVSCIGDIEYECVCVKTTYQIKPGLPEYGRVVSVEPVSCQDEITTIQGMYKEVIECN